MRDAQDRSEASHVESIQLSLFSCVEHERMQVVCQFCEDACTVDLELSLFIDTSVAPNAT